MTVFVYLVSSAFLSILMVTLVNANFEIEV